MNINDSNQQKPPKKLEPRQQDFRQCHLMGSSDPHVNLAYGIVRRAVKLLAFLMVFVILWGILDVGWVLYTKLTAPPYFLLNIDDIPAIFGAFMAVLIAIEIFANIVMYLEGNIIHVRLVLDTAIMAAARKIIVLDLKTVDPLDVFALGVVVAALGVCYLFVTKDPKSVKLPSRPDQQFTSSNSAGEK